MFIRVGRAKDGTIKYFIPEESYDAKRQGTSGPGRLGCGREGDHLVFSWLPFQLRRTL
jgi:hypothetical protein